MAMQCWQASGLGFRAKCILSVRGQVKKRIFDAYMMLIWYDCGDKDSPIFARLCCLKTHVARPERPAKVVSDLLDSLL